MKVLVTAIGCPGFITVYNCIKELCQDMEIYGCDVIQNSNSKIVDNFFIVPKGSNERYPDLILDHCLKNKITHIIPMSDEEIISIGNNLSGFKENKIKVFGEARPGIESIFDKSKLYKLIQNLCVSPIFKHVKNSSDFSSAFQYFKSKDIKMCVKPSLSHGSRGFAIIEKITYEDYISSKSINKISHSQFLEIIDKKNVNIVAMEFLPGEEYSVDAIQFNNQFYCVIRSRDKTINGISSKCTIKNIKYLENKSKEIYKNLKFDYIVNIQFKRDIDNNFKILEINPRIPGGIEFSTFAGVDILKMGFSKFFNLENKKFKSKLAYGKVIEKKWKLTEY